MMNILLEPEAEEYILQNGGNAMVILGSLRGCCGGTSPLAKVALGSPKNLSGYEENKVGAITLYVDKNLKETEKMRITFAKLFWVNKLSVEVQLKEA